MESAELIVKNVFSCIACVKKLTNVRVEAVAVCVNVWLDGLRHRTAY